MDIGLKISKGENVFSAFFDELSFNSKYRQLQFNDPIEDEQTVAMTGSDVIDEFFVGDPIGFDSYVIQFLVTNDGNRVIRIPIANSRGVDPSVAFYYLFGGAGGSSGFGFFYEARAAGAGDEDFHTINYYSDTERFD